jgi:hypothetical protein
MCDQCKRGYEIRHLNETSAGIFLEMARQSHQEISPECPANGVDLQFSKEPELMYEARLK